MNDPQSSRERLFRKHWEAMPRLDALRRACVNSLPRDVTTWSELVRALFAPNRFAWRALAAAWVAIAVFHFTLGRSARPAVENRISPEFAAEWFAQFKTNETFAQIDRHP
jgi:hypothetical protein